MYKVQGIFYFNIGMTINNPKCIFLDWMKTVEC